MIMLRLYNYHIPLVAKYSKNLNAHKNFSPKRILEDFGYVILHEILHLMIPNVACYHFLPRVFIQQPDYIMKYKNEFLIFHSRVLEGCKVNLNSMLPNCCKENVRLIFG